MIVRFLTKEERNKIYNNRVIEEEKSGVRPNVDYVVLSVELVPEFKLQTFTSVEYWIITDEGALLRCDAYNFKIIDSHIPSNWIMDLNERGVELADPKWIQAGYVADYYDDEKVTKEYDKIIRKIFRESVLAAKKKGIELNLSFKNYIGYLKVT